MNRSCKACSAHPGAVNRDSCHAALGCVTAARRRLPPALLAGRAMAVLGFAAEVLLAFAPYLQRADSPIFPCAHHQKNAENAPMTLPTRQLAWLPPKNNSCRLLPPLTIFLLVLRFNTRNMAPPRLEDHQVATVLDCLSASWRVELIARTIGCSRMTIYRIKRSMEAWGEPYAPRSFSTF
ncbi:hypothetical protein B0J12DRAFT_210520 [Macrophomina phaseolina]|uniref:Helix-turn-helix domain-containing protein n=1 Tax=Macrophomina phaseolina TaxID=35725 RepID=A0ABQ8G1S7_9PEZI|nr:hypothetical protein B0J12DRAFT_210520 [Macrophomina phaseolina]